MSSVRSKSGYDLQNCGRDLLRPRGAAEIGRERLLFDQQSFDGVDDFISPLVITEELEHLTDTPDRCERIGDAFAGDIRSGTVDRLEHRGEFSFGIEIGAGGEPHASRDCGSEIGQDIAEQI